MGCGLSNARGALSSGMLGQRQIMCPELREDVHEELGITLVACSLKGWRKTQEDTSSIVINLGGKKDMLGIGVFDGHSGPEASEYVAAHLWNEVTKTSQWADGDVDGALRAAFFAVDENMRREKVCHGTTAVVAVVTPGYLYVANCGDSRAVLCKGGTATALSTDHKPCVCTEAARVIRCGGQVMPGEFGGVSRVTAPGSMVAMATSRSLGDFHFKRRFNSEPGEQVVSPAADVTCVNRTREDEFLILGTDGVWDVLSNQEVSEMMRAAERSQRPSPEEESTPSCPRWETSTNAKSSSSIPSEAAQSAPAKPPSGAATPPSQQGREGTNATGVRIESRSAGANTAGTAADPSGDGREASVAGNNGSSPHAARNQSSVESMRKSRSRQAFIRLLTPNLVRLITPTPPNPVIAREPGTVSDAAGAASASAECADEHSRGSTSEGVRPNAVPSANAAVDVGNDRGPVPRGTLSESDSRSSLVDEDSNDAEEASIATVVRALEATLGLNVDGGAISGSSACAQPADAHGDTSAGGAGVPMKALAADKHAVSEGVTQASTADEIDRPVLSQDPSSPASLRPTATTLSTVRLEDQSPDAHRPGVEASTVARTEDGTDNNGRKILSGAIASEIAEAEPEDLGQESPGCESGKESDSSLGAAFLPKGSLRSDGSCKTDGMPTSTKPQGSAATPSKAGCTPDGSSGSTPKTPNPRTASYRSFRTPVFGGATTPHSRTPGMSGGTPNRRPYSSGGTPNSRGAGGSRISSYRRSGSGISLFKGGGSLSASITGKEMKGVMGAVRGVLDRALVKGSQDNMTLIAVDLRGLVDASPPATSSAAQETSVR